MFRVVKKTLSFAIIFIVVFSYTFQAEAFSINRPISDDCVYIEDCESADLELCRNVKPTKMRVDPGSFIIPAISEYTLQFPDIHNSFLYEFCEQECTCLSYSELARSHL